MLQLCYVMLCYVILYSRKLYYTNICVLLDWRYLDRYTKRNEALPDIASDRLKARPTARYATRPASLGLS